MSLPSSIEATVIELRRPIPRMPELLAALLEPELLASPVTPVRLPVFFALRGRKLSRFELATVPAAHRDALAVELGRGSQAVAMFGGIAGQPDSWAIKVESAALTCTVLLVLRDGKVLGRRV